MQGMSGVPPVAQDQVPRLMANESDLAGLSHHSPSPIDRDRSSVVGGLVINPIGPPEEPGLK